jgi:hypothetical protein
MSEGVITHEHKSLFFTRADLARWEDHAAAGITCGEPVWSVVCEHLDERIKQRIGEALKGCTTPEEVRLVFASVQEHQYAHSY